MSRKARKMGRPPAVKCRKCDQWYSPDGPTAAAHRSGNCPPEPE